MLVAFAKDWNDVPTCATHLLRGMARERDVLWIESIGTRPPSLASGRDLKRIWLRISRALAGPEWKENRLWVWSPLLIPRAESRPAIALNRRLLNRTVKRWRKKLASGATGSRKNPLPGGVREAGGGSGKNANGKPVFPSPKSMVYGLRSTVSSPSGDEYWCFVPNAVDLLPAGKQSKVVYYCVDDWTKFENLDGVWLEEKERRLLERADVVFAVSDYLVEKCRRIAGDRVHFMPHGVDTAAFGAALDPATVIPPELRDAARPVIGFYGNISPWIDFELVRAMALARPDWTFVMLGPVYVDLHRLFRSPPCPPSPVQRSTCNVQRSTCNVQRSTCNVPHIPNILFPGRRDYTELPSWCKAFDAAIIPYDPDHPRMRSVNPVKARELLAAGVPVVACDIAAMRGYGDDVLIAGRDVESWITALERQIGRRDRDAISRRRADDDWSARIERIREIVDRVGGQEFEPRINVERCTLHVTR